MKTRNIMFVGVGGQGTLLASRVIGRLLTDQGYDVKVSEVHGMSQRGGSVVTYVRYGDKVYAPIVAEGTADLIVAFESLEALRYLPSMKKEGTVIYNTQEINPMPVITGMAEYPSEIEEKLRAAVREVVPVDAASLALEAGNIKAVNVVLLGILAKRMEISKDAWMDALKAVVPPKFIELNQKAFELGYAVL